MHARSVAAAAIDGATGELFQTKLTPSHEHVRSGFALAVELGDWHRFTGNTIGSFIGLVPSEYSSGQSRVQGSITKTGNSHVRRLLVEAAWHHRASHVVGTPMRERWELASQAARARGDEGNRRLHHRWNTFRARRMRHVVANAAIARELAGWCWSSARSQSPAASRPSVFGSECEGR